MNDELEKEALTVYRQYSGMMFFAPGVRHLLVKIAARLEWRNLLMEIANGK